MTVKIRRIYIYFLSLLKLLSIYLYQFMAKKKKQIKIFVLDTSVILHDHNALNCFEENDVAIPITVPEELDNFKRGNDTKIMKQESSLGFLDRLSNAFTLQDWIPINGTGKGKFKIVMENEELSFRCC